MKKTGTCPKCKSKKITCVKCFGGTTTPAVNSPNSSLSFIGAMSYLRYICTECGYSEEWLDDSELAKYKR